METYKLTCRCGRTLEVTDKDATVRCKCRKTMVYLEGMHPIAQYRFKYDFTQAELCSLLGFDRSILARIESNSYNPTDEQKKQIRLITGIII